MNSAARALAAAAVAAVTLGAQAPIVQTVLSNGTTQSRYDMVILGDGYQAFEKPLFDQNVTTFLTSLFQQQPYSTFAAYFNVHTVFRASNESGADQPDVNPPIYVDTVYNSTYNVGGTDRCLYIQNTSLALADAALAPANEGRVLVLVNSSRYGGCAGTFAVSYNGSQMSAVQVHELGHSLGLLADEYDYPNQTYTGPEPSQVNVTTSPVGQKWSHWHGTDNISAFEGARYHLYGIYRPRNNCMMRSLGVSMCAVCREQVSKVTNSVVDTIVSAQPATANVTLPATAGQTFSITHIVPAGNNPAITWKLDGAAIPGATGTSFHLAAGAASIGQHTLAVEVLDQTTFVRNDPTALMRDVRTWQVTIEPPPLAQLRVPTFTASSVWVQRGDTVTLSPTVQNDGNAASGPFLVEFFLSTTSIWSPQDVYLGSTVVADLAPAQSTVASKQVQLPWRLPATVHFVHAVVDRANAVPESNETDNGRVVVLIGQTGPCVTKLEYDDPLLYPHDRGAVSVTTGGTLHPTVVAPCADPLATLYLIVWGGAGTTPGVQMSPSALLPLNPDGLTDLGLAALNGPVLGGFLGVFDGQGLGRATFALPPATGLMGGTTHFAALLLGATELFQAATNAIELELLP
ncbi:MAG: hypothetical protein KF830_03630 [Planctomycetes bacterium]|nr:hypothetical protein [Planctomycetota bacterium]